MILNIMKTAEQTAPLYFSRPVLYQDVNLGRQPTLIHVGVSTLQSITYELRQIGNKTQIKSNGGMEESPRSIETFQELQEVHELHDEGSKKLSG